MKMYAGYLKNCPSQIKYGFVPSTRMAKMPFCTDWFSVVPLLRKCSTGRACEPGYFLLLYLKEDCFVYFSIKSNNKPNKNSTATNLKIHSSWFNWQRNETHFSPESRKEFFCYVFSSLTMLI